MKFQATIKSGTLTLNSSPFFKKQVARLKDGRYTLSLERIKSNRSLNQNRYYFGAVLPPIAEYTGYSTEEMHEYYKARFLKKRTLTIGDDEREVVPSSTKLSTDEFSQYIEKIINHASDMGISIQSSEDYMFGYWYNKKKEAQMDCRKKAKMLIDDMNADDVASLVPLLEHIAQLRETIDTLEDSDLMNDIAEGLEELKNDKVSTVETT